MFFDVLVIGSGPAGLSSALYASRAGKTTGIVEGDTLGGLITTTETIDNYIGMPDFGGMDMANAFQEHAVKFGAKMISGSVKTISKTDRTFTTILENGDNIQSHTVIYATGSTPKKLGVKGENLSGVSYCATCDGIFSADEKVIVVGGGETAAEEALYLADIAETVDVFVRGNAFRATAPLVEKLTKHESVTVHMNTQIEEILGEAAVTEVKTIDGKSFDVTGVFVAIGQNPNSHVASHSEHATVFSDGFIERPQTKGFFVAGDVSDPIYRQVAVAVGDGARAGIDATAFLNS